MDSKVHTYPSEKYESQLGFLFPTYGKIKAMFQTTNQCVCIYIYNGKYLIVSKYQKTKGLNCPSKIDLEISFPIS